MEALSDYLSGDGLSVNRASRLVEDLYMDSMGMVEITLLLNSIFCIELSALDVEQWATVMDVACSVSGAVIRAGNGHAC